MSPKIGGERPRPRVYLEGEFEDEVVEKFERMFPTILEEKNDPDIREIDLIIIGDGVGGMGIWPSQTHVICFSNEFGHLPGPIKKNRIEVIGLANTEEYFLPDTKLPYSRRRESDFKSLSNIKNWVKLELRNITTDFIGTIVNSSKETDKNALNIFENGSIINERVDNTVLASIFISKETKLGVAWLPNIIFDKAAWVEIIVTEWAKIDKKSFPQFGDWTNSPEWLTNEEEKIMTEINAFENKKKNAIQEFDKRIKECVDDLSKLKKNINEGRRRLITAQGDELVEEVGNVFEELDFKVELMDDSLEKNAPKREDIRIKDQNKNWEAIIEVRGYAKSGGTTADMSRLNRFEKLYIKEKGQSPDKKIYIVNGQIELLPSQRQKPLASAEEDIEIFSEENGLIIWTLDLFKIMKNTSTEKYDELKENIKKTIGRWE